jgi:hypothetical protein
MCAKWIETIFSEKLSFAYRKQPGCILGITNNWFSIKNFIVVCQKIWYIVNMVNVNVLFTPLTPESDIAAAPV